MKKINKLVLIAFLLAVGTALHAIVPGFFFGMKPDLLLSTMFIAIFLLADKTNVMIIGLVAGMLSGLTSTLPGGLPANLIDKIVTTLIIYLLFLAFRRLLPRVVNAIALTAVGTVISGTVFLTALMLVATLPTGFLAMFITVVLPAAAINTVFIAILFPIIIGILKQTNKNILNNSGYPMNK